MAVTLGLDIGTNSVGSAWVDTERREITLGVSVFPAGVDEKMQPRGQERRGKRAQRRNLQRRAVRKSRLRKLLHAAGLLPSADASDQAFRKLMELDPWKLRSESLNRPLTPHEFGRLLIHLNQRRGWNPRLTEDEEEGDGEEEEEPEKREAGKQKHGVKDAIHDTRLAMQPGQTFGSFIAQKRIERKFETYSDPVRNRAERFEFHGDRQLIDQEFDIVCNRQTEFGGEVARILTAELQEAMRDVIFHQRDTYWPVSSLGRCELEPSDRQCPKGDMYAQRFLVLETVNRIRVSDDESFDRRLTDHERQLTIEKLSVQQWTFAHYAALARA